MVQRRGPQDECLVEGFGLRITRADLHTLNGLTWLNDEVFISWLLELQNSGFCFSDCELLLQPGCSA